MNSLKCDNIGNLKHYEYAGGYISYSPLTLTEHYSIKRFDGNHKEN